ncbi:MAG: hypothetical protein ACK517_01585, partial [bacterium]
YRRSRRFHSATFPTFVSALIKWDPFAQFRRNPDFNRPVYNGSGGRLQIDFRRITFRPSLGLCPAGLNGCRFGGYLGGNSNEKGGDGGCCPYHAGKTLARAISNSLERKPTCRATVAGATPGAAHCSGRLARITTHCTGAAGPRGLSNVNSLTAAR